uniref:DNA-directed RNA polymerase n=1 Tax=Physcomitrium patens TaxID=3218 RepID=A0A2K1J3K0_PHYPA|nr:hypothetical protein PHYPA_021959 [Physcomitrium patens]
MKMYCGTTGLPIEVRVAIGICYYHALRHQARNKAHSISKGVIQSLTKQSVEGRSRKRGLRFREMEKDCLIAHGAASMLLEKLKNTSDLCEIWICHDCSTICSSNPCINCNERNTKEHRLPYSFKLLAQELSIANIKVDLKYSSKVTVTSFDHSRYVYKYQLIFVCHEVYKQINMLVIKVYIALSTFDNFLTNTFLIASIPK